MAKGKNTVFFCQQCGYESPKWLGQCPACKEWNTFVEEPPAPKLPGRAASHAPAAGAPGAAAKPVSLSDVEAAGQSRFTTGIGSLSDGCPRSKQACFVVFRCRLCIVIRKFETERSLRLQRRSG